MPDRDDTLTYARHLQLDATAVLPGAAEREARPPGTRRDAVHHRAPGLRAVVQADPVRARSGCRRSSPGPRWTTRSLGEAVRLLGRIVEIQKLLIQQFDVLETMTPLDFLDFRDLLFPASGLPEPAVPAAGDPPRPEAGAAPRVRRAVLRRAPLAGGTQGAEEGRGEPSLTALVEAWLQRTPFVNVAGYDFREVYRQAVSDMLESEAEVVRRTRAWARRRSRPSWSR